VAAWAGAYTPSVSLDPPDTVLLEVAASLRLFGGAAPLAEAVLGGLARLGLSGQLAGAPTPLAARWLARHAQGRPMVASAELTRRLDALPLTALADGTSVDAASLQLLRAIGASCLADVRRLPRAGLARRQAVAVTQALDRALGRLADPRQWFEPPARYRARLVLPVPCEQIEPLLFLLRRLFAGLAGWLAGRQAGVDRVGLILEHEGRRPPTALEIVCGAPSRDEARLALLAREHLARLELPAPVDALRIAAGHPQPMTGRVADLFDDSSTAREGAALLLDRLRAHLGADAVRGLAPCADHRPEHAWRFQPPADSPQPAPLPAGDRPLWLLPAPRALADAAALTLLAGPERIESGWWDGADVRRDYYVARSHAGSLLWIYRELAAPHGWFLHGYFA
jgi:protein ImuB